jgi:hypothetical protein
MRFTVRYVLLVGAPGEIGPVVVAGVAIQVTALGLREGSRPYERFDNELVDVAVLHSTVPTQSNVEMSVPIGPGLQHSTDERIALRGGSPDGTPAAHLVGVSSNRFPVLSNGHWC